MFGGMSGTGHRYSACSAHMSTYGTSLAGSFVRLIITCTEKHWSSGSKVNVVEDYGVGS